MLSYQHAACGSAEEKNYAEQLSLGVTGLKPEPLPHDSITLPVVNARETN